MNAELPRIETSWNELVNQIQDAGALTQVGAWEHSLLALIEGHDRSLAMGLQEPLEKLDPEEKRPVISWVGGNTYEHYAEHTAWIDQLIKESSAAR